MTKPSSQILNQLTYHRVFADAKGDSHVAVVTIEQTIASAAPPAAPFYISGDKPASKYRFYTFEPGWIGDWHPAPTRQFLALMSGEVEMKTTDGTIVQFKPGNLVLLEDTSGKGHLTKNTGDGYAMFLVIPVPVA